MSECFSDQLRNTLITRLPGAGLDAIDLEIGNAAHEWFLESGTWHDIVYANLIANKDEYTLFPEAGNVGLICDLNVNNRTLHPVSGNSNPVQRWSGHFQCITEFNRITHLRPIPTESMPKAIIANVLVVPDSCTCEIPPDLVDHWYEALLDTALGKLYSHVNKPYTNPSLAMYHVGRYRAHLTRARRTVAGGNVRAGGPWVYPQIAPGRNRRGTALPRDV